MTARVASVLLVSAVLPLVALGCGGASSASGTSQAGAGAAATEGGQQAATPAPPPPPTPLELLPPDAYAVAQLDLERLRESAYYDRVVEWLVAQTNLSGERLQLARDALERADRVVVGVLPPGADGEDPQMAVAVKGDFTEEQLPRLMAQAGEPVDEVHTIAGHRVYIEKDIWAAEVRGPIWVFSDAGWIRTLLERVDSGAHRSSPFDQDDLATMAERIDFGNGSFTGVLRIPPDVRERVGDGRWLSRETGRSLRVLGFRLEAQADLDLEAVVRTTDPEIARRLADCSGGLLRWAGRNVLVSMLGLGPVFSAAQVRPDGPSAVLTLHLDAAQVDRLMRRLERMAGRVLDSSGVDLKMGGTGGGPKGPPASTP